MIAQKDDHRLFRKTQPVQRVEHLPDLRVHKRGGGVISLSCLPPQWIGQLGVFRFLAHKRAGGELPKILLKGREGNLIQWVLGEIRFRRHVRCMRSVKTYPDEKGSVPE